MLDRVLDHVAPVLAFALTLALSPVSVAANDAGQLTDRELHSRFESRWQLKLRSDRHSDGLPLRDLDDDNWDKLVPRAGRNLAYVHDELRITRRHLDWAFSLLARSSATLVVNNEALTLAQQIANGQLPAADARWQTDMRLRGFSGAGVELGRGHTLSPEWSARWSVQALALTRWRDRSLHGPVSFDAASATYSFDLHSRETNDRLRFPFQESFDPRGAGLLLGGELAWQGERWSAALALHDGGWLRWAGVPQQRARLNTATQTFDADGFLVYQPLIVGQNTQEATTVTRPWHGTLKTAYRMTAATAFGLTIDTVPGFGALPALRWRQRLGAVELGIAWRVHERRATLSASWRGWQLRAGTDRFGAGSHSRELMASYSVLR